MAETLSWAAYGGLGQLGTHLRQELATKPHIAERHGLEPAPDFIAQRCWVLSSDGSQVIARHPNELRPPDVAFITLPSDEENQVAYDYMEALLENGVLVITAEKAALATRFAKLQSLSDNFKRLGINAAVGGGMRAMEAARVYTHDPHNVSQLHGGLNASTNFSLELMGQGLSLEAAARQTVEGGYADPGADDDPRRMISVETADFRKKVPTFLNRLGILPRLLGLEEVEFELDEAGIDQLVAEPWRRPVISAYNQALTTDQPEPNNLGGRPLEIEDWLVTVGYRDLRQPTLFQKPFGKLTGAWNGIVMQLGPEGEDSPQPIVISGTGAGLGPTVNTMLDDFLMLRENI